MSRIHGSATGRYGCPHLGAGRMNVPIYTTLPPRPHPVRALGWCSLEHWASELWDGICAFHWAQIFAAHRHSTRRTLWRSLLGVLWLVGYVAKLLLGGLCFTSPFWLAVLYLHAQGVI